MPVLRWVELSLVSWTGRAASGGVFWSVCELSTLEKEMATHSSILAWEVSWTEEPGRLQVRRVAESWTPALQEPTKI